MATLDNTECTSYSTASFTSCPTGQVHSEVMHLTCIQTRAFTKMVFLILHTFQEGDHCFHHSVTFPPGWALNDKTNSILLCLPISSPLVSVFTLSLLSFVYLHSHCLPLPSGHFSSSSLLKPQRNPDVVHV